MDELLRAKLNLINELNNKGERDLNNEEIRILDTLYMDYEIIDYIRDNGNTQIK